MKNNEYCISSNKNLHLSDTLSIFILRSSVKLGGTTMLQENPEDRRRTVRVPVDSVLLYRTMGTDNYRVCHVVNVSTKSAEIVLDHILARGDIVIIAVRPEGTRRQYYRVVGEVKRRARHDTGWMHIITAPSGESWDPMFIYDVLCSTFDHQPKEVDACVSALEQRVCGELTEHRAEMDTRNGSMPSLRQVA